MKYAIIPVTHYRQNCTLLWCEATRLAVAIDPGGHLERITEAANTHGVTIDKLLITHGHMDHCIEARVLADRLGVPLVGPHEADRELLQGFPQHGKDNGFPELPAFEPDQWLQHGDTVAFGQELLEVIHCPGHAPGHLVYFHRADKLAIVGDVLFAGTIGRWDYIGGDFDQLIMAIRERLFPLGDDVSFVPGHGRMSTFGAERLNNKYVADHLFSTKAD